MPTAIGVVGAVETVGSGAGELRVVRLTDGRKFPTSWESHSRSLLESFVGQEVTIEVSPKGFLSNIAPLVRLRLFDWGPSPFCMKVRAVLDYKGVRYERVPVLGPSSLRELMRRSPVGKVPALDVDGRLIVDSTDIAHEIERLFPEPAIVPNEARLRGLSHALEDWADEALYFIGLYFQWIDPRGRPMVRRAFGSSPLGVVARVFYQHRIAAQVRGQGTGRKSAEQVAADLRRELDALAGMLEGRPFLLGDTPWLCDFAVNAQLVYLSRPPASAELLHGYAALAAYMERMKSLRAAT